VGKHCSKTKIILGNIVATHSVFFRKTTKQNSQPTQYEKNKIDKDRFGKKNSFKKKKKKSCCETL
jgi:hypothetical protein